MRRGEFLVQEPVLQLQRFSVRGCAYNRSSVARMCQEGALPALKKKNPHSGVPGDSLANSTIRRCTDLELCSEPLATMIMGLSTRADAQIASASKVARPVADGALPGSAYAGIDPSELVKISDIASKVVSLRKLPRSTM